MNAHDSLRIKLTSPHYLGEVTYLSRDEWRIFMNQNDRIADDAMAYTGLRVILSVVSFLGGYAIGWLVQRL